MIGKYICTKCLQSKPSADFYRNRLHGKMRRTNWCKECFKSLALTRHARIKKTAVYLMGGKCICCSYSTFYGSLEFHHIDVSQKDFGISKSIRSIESTVKEISKCVLVCSNCHKELHAGVRQLPSCYRTGYDEELLKSFMEGNAGVI